MVLFIIGLIIEIIVIIPCAIFAPRSPRRRRYSRGGGRRSKGFFAGLLEGQARTERRNSSHRGVMCGPGGVGARGGKRR